MHRAARVSHVQKSRTTAKKSDLERRIAALVADYRQGDSTAAGKIVAHMQPALWAKIHARVPSPLVDDAYQESWLRFFRGLDTDVNPDSYIAWFLGIARIVALEMMRAEHREAPLPEDADDRYQDETPTPSRLAEASQLRAAIFECLGKIPERYGRLLVGHVRGEPRERLCEELNLSMENFGKLLYRARKSLQQCLGPLSRFFDEDE
ncbi:MAG: sigma-70 family RNA polymerase sigma factor [Pseudomonadota bacterium]